MINILYLMTISGEYDKYMYDIDAGKNNGGDIKMAVA